MSDATPQEGVVSAHSDAEGILIVRVFDAPRERVFKAWTKPNDSRRGSASTDRRSRSTRCRWMPGRAARGAPR